MEAILNLDSQLVKSTDSAKNWWFNAEGLQAHTSVAMQNFILFGERKGYVDQKKLSDNFISQVLQQVIPYSRPEQGLHGWLWYRSYIE